MNGRRAVRSRGLVGNPGWNQGAGRRHGGAAETEPKTNREAGT